MQYEGYLPSPQPSWYASAREALNPVGRFVRSVFPPQRDNRLELAYPYGLPPQALRPPSSHSTHHVATVERGDRQLPRAPSGFQPAASSSSNYTGLQAYESPSSASVYAPRPTFQDHSTRPQSSSGHYPWDTGFRSSQNRPDYGEKTSPKRDTLAVANSIGDERPSKRYRGGRDEFDGSVQYLSKPPRSVPEPRERDLPPLPVHLESAEQDHILTEVNKRLSQCAFDFVALYRFPIPIEPDKPPVQSSADKGWSEWAYLLKRLATKRRIPSHAIYQGQIKELTTVLDNSLEMRHATKPQIRPQKDDRAVLQFISAGIQVGKILKDAAAMEHLDKLYQHTEKVIKDRKESLRSSR